MSRTLRRPASVSTANLATLPRYKPEYTLGWEAYRWIRENLIQPNGPRAGLEFLPTKDQLQFLLLWYEFNPKTGEWVYNRGARRLAKGSGKSPWAAVLALVEFCAPVRLDRIDRFEVR